MTTILLFIALVVPPADRQRQAKEETKSPVVINWPKPVQLSAKERAGIISTFVYPWGNF